jgi:nitrogen fixation/metabolism regulation signal transduction histidine kinase
MIVYFLLIGFASLFVGVEFVAETQGDRLKSALLDNLDQYTNHQIDADQLLRPIEHLKSKALLMLAVVLCVMVIVLTMFIKNITEPLQHMLESSKQIAKGDLSQTICVHDHTELSELGMVINDLTSNLQEITFLAGNLCNAGQQFVNQTEALLDTQTAGTIAPEQLREQVDFLKAELTLLKDVIECFNFYTVANSTHD